MRWESEDEDYPAVLRWRKFWLRDGDDEVLSFLQCLIRELTIVSEVSKLFPRHS